MTETRQFKTERALTWLMHAENQLHDVDLHADADKVGDIRLDILKRAKR